MKKAIPAYILYVPVILGTASLGLFLYAVYNGWFGPAGVRGAHFCECYNGLIKQPINTWSNFGFMAAGLYTAWRSYQFFGNGNHNLFTRNKLIGVFYASLLVVMGPASMALHATMTPIGNQLDLFSCYLITAFVLSYALLRFYRLKTTHFILSFIAVIIFCEWVGSYPEKVPVFTTAGSAVFGSLLLLAVLIEIINSYIRKPAHEIQYAWLAVGTGVASFIIWNIGQTGSSVCRPHSLFQTHAVWHILNALALIIIHRFYLSEDMPPEALPTDSELLLTA